MSTPSVPHACTPISGSGRKLRFDLDEAQPKLRSAMKSSADSNTNSKGSSPTVKAPSSTDVTSEADTATTKVTAYTFSGGHAHGSFANSGVRRSSENGDALRVSVNPEPSAIVDAAASPDSPTTSSALRAAFNRMEESEVAQALADIGMGAAQVIYNATTSPNGGSADGADADENAIVAAATEADPLTAFRPLLLRLAGLLLTRRPAKPERFLVDHFSSKALATVGGVAFNGIRVSPPPPPAAGSNTNASANSMPQGGGAGGCVTTRDRDTDIGHTHSHSTGSNGPATDGGDSGSGKAGGNGKGTSQLLSFAPVGDTVIQRLAFPAPVGVGRAIVERMAKLLFDVKPEDPEMFLWTKLDSRSFSDEAAAASMVAFTSDGFPLLPPEDPTQAALLKLVPASSPGYNVAANVIPILFAKKPKDPTNYLFLHLTSRTRSSAAGSVRSSVNYGTSNTRTHAHPHQQLQQRLGQEEDNTSCTSRDLADYEEADDEVDVEDDESGSVSKDGLSPEQNAVVTSFLSNLQRKELPSALPRSRGRRCSAGASSTGRHRSTDQSAGGGTPSAGSSRGTGKRVYIAADPVISATFPASGLHEPTSATYGSSTAATAGHSFGGNPSNTMNFSPSFYQSVACGHGSGNGAETTAAAHLMEAERLRAELVAMSVRDSLRLERTQYEVDVLRREVDFLTKLTLLDKSDHARAAAAAATEALVVAEVHLRFLEGRHHYLQAELIPRQLSALHSVAPSPSAQHSP